MEIVAVIKAFLVAKGAVLASGAGIGLALGLLSKFGMKAWSNFLGKNIRKLTDLERVSDPKERELLSDIVFAVVKWVEYKLPDRGMGSKRFELAVNMLVEWWPALASQKALLAKLIEEAVVRMDEAAKSVLTKKIEIPQ